MGGSAEEGNTHSKFVVELVGEERVGELAEVRLAEGADAVDVLQVDILLQVRAAVTVELLPASEAAGSAGATGTGTAWSPSVALFSCCAVEVFH